MADILQNKITLQGLRSVFISGFGIFMLIFSLLFYNLGSTPTAKTLLIPMLVIGIFFKAAGVNMIYSNGKKVQEVEARRNQKKNCKENRK